MFLLTFNSLKRIFLPHCPTSARGISCFNLIAAGVQYLAEKFHKFRFKFFFDTKNTVKGEFGQIKFQAKQAK